MLYSIHTKPTIINNSDQALVLSPIKSTHRITLHLGNRFWAKLIQSPKTAIVLQ